MVVVALLSVDLVESIDVVVNCILLTFHNQGSWVKSAFATNAQSRFAPVVVDVVLGLPRLARHP